MKLSKLIEVLKNVLEKNGEMDVYAAGHPGEIGFSIEEENIETTEKKKELFFIF
jgi:hypothetical protein